MRTKLVAHVGVVISKSIWWCIVPSDRHLVGGGQAQIGLIRFAKLLPALCEFRACNSGASELWGRRNGGASRVQRTRAAAERLLFVASGDTGARVHTVRASARARFALSFMRVRFWWKIKKYWNLRSDSLAPSPAEVQCDRHLSALRHCN